MKRKLKKKKKKSLRLFAWNNKNCWKIATNPSSNKLGNSNQQTRTKEKNKNKKTTSFWYNNRNARMNTATRKWMCVCLKQRAEKTAVCAFPPFHHHAYYHHSAAQRAFPSTVCCWLTMDGEWEGVEKRARILTSSSIRPSCEGFIVVVGGDVLFFCCWFGFVWGFYLFFMFFFCRGDLSACRSDLFFSEVFLWWFSGGFSAFQKVGGKA